MDNDKVELAERSNDGLEVRLLWRRDTREIVLEVADNKTGTVCEVHVPDYLALDAFEHPFLYIGRAYPLPDAAVV
jgi:hypothetical protein